MLRTREDIKDFVNDIEKNFPINTWKMNEVHVWPILRIHLYFYLILKIEGEKEVSSIKPINIPTKDVKVFFFRRITYKIKRLLRKLYVVFKDYSMWKQKLPQKDFLFLGAMGHRVTHKGMQFNKYFDVLIEQHQIKKASLFFEYDSSSISNQYHKDLLFKFDKALIAFKIFFSFNDKNISFDNEGYSQFLGFLHKSVQTKDFSISYSEEKISHLVQRQLAPKILFFKKVLQKIKPKKVIVLCYYSDDIMLFVAAANQLGIETIEMQHGPQIPIHLAYGSWSSVPEKGYDMLPRTYWCWDSYSKKVLDDWGKDSPLYKTRIIGNPWVDYWKKKQDKYLYNNYILYSLQPSPLTFEQLFNDILIEFIKKEPYIWFIRLHPRQLGELETIKILLENKGILNKVNVDNATNDALPQLLSNAKIHITHFSGTAIEASFFDKKTILLNAIGLTSFPELIKANKAVYLNMEEVDFYQKMIEIIEDEVIIIGDDNRDVLKSDNLFE